MESSNLRSISTTDAQQSNSSNEKIYYPRASTNSPDLSYLPLSPKLDRPATLRLIPTGTTTTMPPIVSAIAFELSTPAALLQSVHFYFADHLATNIALGLHPTFDTACLESAHHAYSRMIETNRKIRGALSTNEGADEYVRIFVQESARRRLQGVIVYVHWEMGEQEERQARMARIGRVVRMARMERQAVRIALRSI